MRRQGKPFIGVGEHVLGIVQRGVGEEPRTRHRGLVLNLARTLVANHPMPVPEQVPEFDILIYRPLPKRLKIAAPISAGTLVYKPGKFGNLACRLCRLIR